MMKPRHSAAAGALLLACLGFGPSAFGADAYPARTITILTPFAAGSVTDAAARVVAQALQDTLGQSVVVENRAGAGGLLAANAVARASNDGYALLLTTNSTHSVVYGLFKNVPYDPIKDFTPIARIGSFASFVAVTPDKPYQSMKALVDHARANPGKLSYGAGNSTSQIVGEALKKRTGTDIIRVPYRSNPMVMTDLLGGQIQIMIADLYGGMPQLKAGKVNALAVLTRTRHPALPDNALRDGDARLSHPGLGRDVRPGRHAARGGEDTRRRAAQGGRKSGGAEAIRIRRHRHLLERLQGIRGIREDRARQLDRDDQGGGHRAGVRKREPGPVQRF